MEEKLNMIAPPPYFEESPVQRFRYAVKAAAEQLLRETGAAADSVQLRWSEPKSGERGLKSLKVGFAADEYDANMIWFPDGPHIYPEPYLSGAEKK